MSASIFINLDTIISKAYKLGLESNHDDEPLSMLDLRSLVLGNIQIGSSSVPTEKASEKPKAKSGAKTTQGDKPKQTRTRTVPADEFRCMAKTSTGGRCAIKKLADGDFCKFHEFKQPFGIWQGEEEVVEMSAPPPKKAITKKPVSDIPSNPTVKKQSAAPSDAIVKSKPEAKKASAPVEKPKNKKILDLDDLEDNDDFIKPMKSKDLEPIEIDDDEGETKYYLINSKNEVFNPENDKKIGVYDRKKQEWISGGHVKLEDYEDYDDQMNHLDAFLGDIKSKKTSEVEESEEESEEEEEGN